MKKKNCSELAPGSLQKFPAPLYIFFRYPDINLCGILYTQQFCQILGWEGNDEQLVYVYENIIKFLERHYFGLDLDQDELITVQDIVNKLLAPEAPFSEEGKKNLVIFLEEKAPSITIPPHIGDSDPK